MDYFTLEEAEEILPEVEQTVRTIRRLHRKIRKLSQESEEEIELKNEEEGISLKYSFVTGSPEADIFIRKINSKLAFLEHTGIILKDIEKGVVEFPSLFQDKQICYLWELGHEHIRHWNSEDDGFEKNQKILDLRRS